MTSKNNIHVLSRAVIIDAGYILLCKTLDLTNNFYFLPGGHIEHGESAENALLREIKEETGAEGIIKRLLGCLEHSFEPGHNSICHNHEYNFVFEVESETLKLGKPMPRHEDHIALIWVDFKKIDEIDLRAEPMRTLLPKWLKNEQNNILQSVMI